MSFNIKSSFVSRAVVEDNTEIQISTDVKESSSASNEVYDPRTLYERLQEQKAIKEEKFFEESRFANQIKRVNEEEAEYFKILADEKEKVESQRRLSERLELEEYRMAVESAKSTPSVAAPVLDKKKKISFSKPNKLVKNNQLKKGTLFVKKRRQEDSSSDEENSNEEANEKSNEKTSEKSNEKASEKPKVPASASLSLLSAYSDIPSSDEE
ncbi:hypothetical protein EDC96DRAFT_473448 [Choanephora cucurbitarum]|nr:hypothetical protein EDC96DRAFT_473448 [Choanephora cucurbitarum]